MSIDDNKPDIKVESKENKDNISMKKKIIIEKEEIIDEKINETKVEIKEEPKEIRKYLTYKDGKIRYIVDIPKDNSIKEGLSLKAIKENIRNMKDEISREKKRFDKRAFVNKLLIGFIIFSMLFIYFYYIKDSGYKADIGDTPPIVRDEIIEHDNIKQSNSIEIDKTIGNDKDGVPDLDTSLTKETIKKETIKSLRNSNSDEVLAIERYLGVKGNRISTISAVKKHKTNKENLFKQLMEYEELFKKDRESYDYLEQSLVESLIMSNEFLELFDNNGKKTEFEDIINKYK